MLYYLSMSKEEESRLISLLKDNYQTYCLWDGSECKSLSREINRNLSAKIFHKLGLIYMKRNASKLCPIQSATLFAAAYNRNQNDKIIEDLEKLWYETLSKAKAQNGDISLQVVSNRIQKNVRYFRLQTKRQINQLPKLKVDMSTAILRQMETEKITRVEKIQDEVYSTYKDIMSEVAHYCLDIQGQAPCKFVLVGMGSLARKEVTPYSDFECIILLEQGVQKQPNYEDILEYFRWFAVIFQIILISLGETILPSVAISGLNDFGKKGGDWFYDSITPSGISFDGFMPHACKTPLGRQEPTKKKPWTTELIKPVDEMLTFLNINEILKNGYHLGDILLATCFVYGDKSLYDEFSSKASLAQKKDHKKRLLEYNKQLKKDLLKFDLLKAFGDLLIFDKFNVKAFFYRSLTIFISTLGKIFECTSLSSFGILSELNKKRRIPVNSVHKLKYAFAISCEARLKVYSLEGCQADEVDGSLNVLLDAVGEKGVLDYLTVTSWLQLVLQPCLLPYFNPQASSFKLVFTDKSQEYKRMFLALHYYIQIELFETSAERDILFGDPCFATFLVLFAFHEENKAVDVLVKAVQHIVDKNERFRFKQRGKYSLRKREYNYLDAGSAAKKVLILKSKRKLYRRLALAATRMWELFCRKFRRHCVELEQFTLILEPSFIRSDLDQPISQLHVLLKSFKKTHIKSYSKKGCFTKAFFVLGLFKFYRALQKLESEVNSAINMWQTKHKKLRLSKIKSHRNLKRAGKN